MDYSKDDIIKAIKEIRIEIGHEDIDINISKLIFDENNNNNDSNINKRRRRNTNNINVDDTNTNNIWIITSDRSDKSSIIGKGGWVVGKLREKLGFNQVHVEAESDFMVKRFKMDLAFERISKVLARIYNTNNNNIDGNNGNNINNKYKNIARPLENLEALLEERMTNIYNFSFNNYINDNYNENRYNYYYNNCSYKNNNDTNNNKYSNNDVKNDNNGEEEVKTILALSGGVDSSYSLIIAKYLGFNPIAITVDPGTIVLPKHLKYNIENLCSKLNVEHHYIKLDYTDIINNSLAGKYHPCGRCSKEIDNAIHNYASENKANFIIFGDMLSTGYQSIVEIDDKNNSKIMKINLPAFLSVGKLEIKELTKEFGVKKVPGFGCPLLNEVQKKHPYMRKFSIQRVLRETRAGALEPGEALDLIWSFVK